MSDPIEAFRAALVGAGLTPPDALHGDGVLHRFSTTGRHGDASGWYVLHLDGIPAGSFGDWRNGMHQTWCSQSKDTMTEAEREAYRQRAQAMRVQRDAEQAQRHKKASESAAELLDLAEPLTGANWHPYLKDKCIRSHGARLACGNLLIPMRDTAGNLHSLQTIGPDGSKRFHPGGRVSGLFYWIGPSAGPLIVCEGFATGASLHEATGQSVAVAFNAGNLYAVAMALRDKHPGRTIILAADDDHLTDGNPGLTKATAAALAVGGLLAVPMLPADRPDKATDFNDLHQIHGGSTAGLEAVRACIAAAMAPAEPVTVQPAQPAAPATVVQRGQTFPPLPDAGDDPWSDHSTAQPLPEPDEAPEPWPDPVPLPNDLPPVAPFAPELLPEALRGWVLDISHRMQCPPDFAAVGAVVALSSLIGARAVVRPKERDDWQVVPNLWGLIVGRPGVMKSPALGESLKPLHRLQANEMELAQAARESWELDCKVSAMEADANEKKAKALAAKGDASGARALLEPVPMPPEPQARRYIVNDATVEKLGEMMMLDPWGLLGYRDELYGLLSSMDKQGQEGARAFYLQGYDGNQGYTFDRIARGTQHIPRVCLSMLGGVQPGRLQEYVRGAVAGGSADDGLLQRFGLAVWPDTGGKFVHVDQWPDTPAKQTAWAVFERLAQLQPASDTEPVIWRFTPEAQAVYVEWATAFGQELKRGDLHPAMESHLSKYRKLIPALALVFAQVDTPDSGSLIHERELLRALDFGDYLRTHAERMYAAAVTPESSGARALLEKIKAGKVGDGFTVREVKRNGWAGLHSTELVKAAADLLADYDWLRCDVVKSGGTKGGRPSEIYTINPAALTSPRKGAEK